MTQPVSTGISRGVEEVLTRFADAGIDIDVLAAQLQDEGAKSFVKSWEELMECIATNSEAVKKAG